MKKLTYSFLLLTLFLFSTTDTLAVDKVTICHVLATPDQTLEVSPSALDVHLSHGDYLGACTEAPSVPEFGLITGVITLLASAGSFALFRRKV